MIVREVIRVRKQDQKERDEQETLVEVYLQAIKDASSVAQKGRILCGKGCLTELVINLNAAKLLARADEVIE
jgi:hypothetical protein